MHQKLFNYHSAQIFILKIVGQGGGLSTQSVKPPDFHLYAIKKSIPSFWLQTKIKLFQEAIFFKYLNIVLL